MNNPNPFVPQGSLLEQQSKRRSRLKLGVFCVLALGVAGLAAMLIQGCKREQNEISPESAPPAETNAPPAEEETNVPPVETSNTPTPQVVAPTVAPQPPPAPEETEYVIVKGDTFSKIAKDQGVTVKAIEEANPNILPTRLQIGQKIVIPASTGATTAAETTAGMAAGGEEIYTVKSGDTLTKIAHKYGVTVKAIETENDLSTTKIKVGQKLKIPAKAETAPAPSSVNAPPETTVAPAPEPANPAPAPTNSPSGP